MSTGEVISAIIAYLSVPALLNLDFFTRDKLLLVSFSGIAVFSLITFYLGKKIKNKSSKKSKSKLETSNPSENSIVKEPYFQLIFLSVFLAVIIQLLIDFSLMEVSAQQMTDPNELAKYFAFLFGGMRVLELILKSFVSKYLVREYGVFISLSTLIFALAFIAIIGISSLFFGYFGMILIVASLSKVFERSLYRSIYAPTINVLYQAYPSTKRAFTQNYADGFGKTIGQLMAAALLFIIATISTFETRVFVLLLSILLILSIWFIVSKKLIFHYKIELLNILNALGNSTKSPVIATNIKKDVLLPTNGIKIKNELTNLEEPQKTFLSLKNQTDSIAFLFKKESQEKEGNNHPSTEEYMHASISAGNQKLPEIISNSILAINEYGKNELLQLLNYVNSIQEKNTKESKLLQLFHLYIQVSLFRKTVDFNFYNSNKKLRTLDFLSSALIQNLAVAPIQNLSNQDYYYLLEERIQKYTYLLSSYRDIGKTSPILSNIILSEAKATKFDILYTLNFKHDQKILNQIVQMLNQGEKSQDLIALELLELVLEEQEKKWILPIFREEQLDNVLKKLEAEFPQVLLGKEKRLISILGNNVLDLPSIIKSIALEELISSFPDLAYTQLAITIAKNSKGIIQYVAHKSDKDKLESNDLKYGNQPKYYEDLLAKTIEFYQKSEIYPTLHYFYWIKEYDMENPKENSIESVYRTLYQSVFPMDRLELNLQD